MSRPQQSEPLFIVHLHDPQAERLFKKWHSANPTASVQIAGQRMRIYDHRSWSLFQINWRGDWDLTTVWDTWRRCHIHLS